jgi:Protein of unknown function (DUF4239)
VEATGALSVERHSAVDSVGSDPAEIRSVATWAITIEVACTIGAQRVRVPLAASPRHGHAPARASDGSVRQNGVVGRALLNTVPEWLLILIFVAGTIIVAFGGFVLTRTKLSAWRAEQSSQVVLAVSAIAMTFFALVLALVIVDLYNGYQQASADVTKEANTLVILIQDGDAFPYQHEEALREAVHNYVREVSDVEFPALRNGQEDARTPEQLLRISLALRQYNPETQTQIIFYNSAVSQVNDLVAERDDRVSTADSSVPDAVGALLVVLALVSLVTTLFLRTHHPGLDLTLVAAVAVIIGLGLVSVLLLAYPFSGSVAVSPEPLEKVATFSALTVGP